MLRNLGHKSAAMTLDVLNEVLSLNAQEWAASSNSERAPALLNEVLSLNAQESEPLQSLNQIFISSMKS